MLWCLKLRTFYLRFSETLYCEQNVLMEVFNVRLNVHWVKNNGNGLIVNLKAFIDARLYTFVVKQNIFMFYNLSWAITAYFYQINIAQGRLTIILFI